MPIFLTWLTLLSYIGVLVILALKDRRQSSPEQYLIASRRVGWFAIMASLAGNLRDGAGIASWIVLSIYYGYGALWLTTGLAAAIIVFAYLAPRIREIALQNNYVTVNQLLQKNIGTRTAKISVVIVAITALLVAGAQVYVSGRFFASLFSITPSFGMAITAGLVGFYLLLGGFASTIRTGIVQWILIMMIIAIPWLFSPTGHISEVSPLTNTSLMDVFTFFTLSFLVVFSSADIWQLMFSAKSIATARKGLLVTIPVYYAISIGLVLLASVISQTIAPDTSPNDALFAILQLPGISPVALSLLGLFIIASVMSTLDSQVFLFTSTVLREFLPTHLNNNNVLIKRYTQWSILVTIIVLTIIAVSIGNIVEFLFGAVTLATILVPVLIIALLSKIRTSETLDILISSALVATTGVYIVMFVQGAFSNLPFTLLPAGIATALCTLSLLSANYGNTKSR